MLNVLYPELLNLFPDVLYCQHQDEICMYLHFLIYAPLKEILVVSGMNRVSEMWYVLGVLKGRTLTFG